MGLKKNCLALLVSLLFSFIAVVAQEAPTPPAVPDAPREFSFYLGGGSYLGIYPEDVTSENMGRLNLREPRGVAVTKVIDGSPADKAGLKKDDVVLRFNGEEVTSVRKLKRMIGEVAPDHVARVTISRNGAEQELSITVGKNENFHSLMTPGMENRGALLDELHGAPNAYSLVVGTSRRIGISTNTLTKQLADYFGVAGDKGVLVTSVKENSPAAKAGLKAGDVITEVDGEKIDGAGDLSRLINRKSEGDISLTVVRDKSLRSIRVTPEKGEAMPFVSPEFNIETTPRVGSIPNIRVMPKIRTIVMPRIEAIPRVRVLLDARPL